MLTKCIIKSFSPIFKTMQILGCYKSTASENQFLKVLKITYFTIGGIVAVFQTASENRF